MDWYRAWVGACSDEKITEAKLICELPRVLLIALWHALLESACKDEAAGAYSATPRRLGAVLEEPAARIEAALAAFAEVGLLRDGVLVNWTKRQPNSETRSAAAERQRRVREAKRDGDPYPELGLDAPVTACHGVSRRVTAQETEEDSEPEISSSSRGGAREGPPEIDLSAAKPLPTRDLLEAEARTLMGEAPVVVDADFSPISMLLGEPGITRADVIAGLSEARDTPSFRPVSWRQYAGWVRKAAKNRLGAAMQQAEARAGPGGFARPPPGPRPPRPPSALSVCLEIALGDAKLGDAAGGNARPESAYGGPTLEGRAVAL